MMPAGTALRPIEASRLTWLGADRAPRRCEVPRAREVALVEPYRSGQRISRYVLGKRLGRGGMGVVHAAHDTRLDRLVALKLLPGSLVADQEWRHSFWREAYCASLAAHPHVAMVFDVGEADEIPFLAMELVDGQSLKALLASQLPLDAARVLAIARMIAGGLARVHAQGVVHRDIKPDNVMVARDGTIKLVDFGIAKPLWWTDAPFAEHRPEQDDHSASRTGRVVGTAAYMAPEQAYGGEVDLRADIYATGVLLRELWGAVRPSRGIPADLAVLLQRCLETDPERRFPDAGALQIALGGLKPWPPFRATAG